MEDAVLISTDGDIYTDDDDIPTDDYISTDSGIYKNSTQSDHILALVVVWLKAISTLEVTSLRASPYNKTCNRFFQTKVVLHDFSITWLKAIKTLVVIWIKAIMDLVVMWLKAIMNLVVMWLKAIMPPVRHMAQSNHVRGSHVAQSNHASVTSYGSKQSFPW